MNAAIDRRLKSLDSILNSDRPKSELETLCIQRQIADLQNDGKDGLHWDELEAQRAINFCELLYHWQGKKAGTPFIPEPWQSELIIAPIFGWQREVNGGLKRRFTVGYIEVPRKNGKTLLLSMILSQGLIADNESGPEVYAAATTRDQASIVFRDCRNTLQQSRHLSSRVKMFRHAIINDSNDGTLQAVSSDYNFLQGKRPSRVGIDELHAHKTRDVWDALITGMGSRPKPLMVATTTAGYDRASICWEQHEFARKVLENHVEEDTYFTLIASADAEDDPFDPETWKKANPNLGVSLEYDFIETESRKAESSASAENTFRRLHLNQWTQQNFRWLPMHLWDSCEEDYSEDDLRGRECYVGVDFASSRDVNAMTAYFPDEQGGRLLAWFWVPEESVDERAESDRRQVLYWATEGYIRKTHGNIADFDGQIPSDMLEIMSRYDVRSLAYDPWGPAEPIMQKLVSGGFTHEKLVKFRQTIGNFTGPMKEFERMVASRQIRHNGNPVLRWMASNVAAYKDANDNIRPDKAKSADKIDGIVAGIMALSEAKFAEKENDSFSFEVFTA